MRHVRYLDAILATAHIIATRRAGEDKLAAESYLNAVTEKFVVTSAMMADAGEEVNLLVKFFDQPNFDAAAAGHQVNKFVATLDILFLQKKVLTLSTHTRFAIASLEGSTRYIKVGDAVRTLGGRPVSDIVLNRALELMASWVALTIRRAQAEFPEAHLMSALEVFHLPPPSRDRTLEALSQFAGVFKLDKDELQAQYDSCLPHVLALAQKARGSRLRLPLSDCQRHLL